MVPLKRDSFHGGSYTSSLTGEPIVTVAAKKFRLLQRSRRDDVLFELLDDYKNSSRNVKSQDLSTRSKNRGAGLRVRGCVPRTEPASNEFVKPAAEGAPKPERRRERVWRALKNTNLK